MTMAMTIDGVVNNKRIEVIKVPQTKRSRSIHLSIGSLPLQIVSMKLSAPIVEEMSGEYDGKAVIGKVDVDSNPNIAMKYGIRNIPTVLFVKGGELVDKQVGAAPKTAFTAKLDALL